MGRRRRRGIRGQATLHATGVTWCDKLSRVAGGVAGCFGRVAGRPLSETTGSPKAEAEAVCHRNEMHDSALTHSAGNLVRTPCNADKTDDRSQTSRETDVASNRLQTCKRGRDARRLGAGLVDRFIWFDIRRYGKCRQSDHAHYAYYK